MNLSQRTSVVTVPIHKLSCFIWWQVNRFECTQVNQELHDLFDTTSMNYIDGIFTGIMPSQSTHIYMIIDGVLVYDMVSLIIEAAVGT